MKYKIGDVVQFAFCKDMTGVVSGYAIGKAFAPYFGFKEEDEIVLATRENGTVLVFKQVNPDWHVVDHVDMASALAKISIKKEIGA